MLFRLFRLSPIVWYSILCLSLTLLLQFFTLVPLPRPLSAADLNPPAPVLVSSARLMSATPPTNVLDYLPQRRVGSSTR